MILEIDGIMYRGFTEQSLSRSLDNICSTFSFTGTSDELEGFPAKCNSLCKVYLSELNFFPVLTGFVEVINIDYSNNQHNIKVEGRSTTSILVDSSVWDKKKFSKNLTFTAIATQIISDLGASFYIGIDDQVLDLTPFEFDIDAEVGESAFKFLERIARIKQITLTTDGLGNLVFTRGKQTRIPTILLNNKNNTKNNILSANANFDISKRYNSYKVIGQSEGDILVSLGLQTSIEGNATDSDQPDYKKLIIVGEENINQDIAKKRAEWEANIRRARSITYNCTVQGLYYDNDENPWEPNIVVYVNDVYAGIKSDLLIKSIEYKVSEQGSFTTLELIFPDAYNLEASFPEVKKRFNLLESLGIGS